jgi:hypothetical protein
MNRWTHKRLERSEAVERFERFEHSVMERAYDFSFAQKADSELTQDFHSWGGTIIRNALRRL